MTETHLQSQTYNGKKYSVSRLIDIAKDLPVENVDIRAIFKNYEILPEYYDIVDLTETISRVSQADLKHPILLYRGFVMDGKHRLTKAVIQNKKTVRVKYLTELPIPSN